MPKSYAAIFLLLFPLHAMAQSTKLGESCNLAVFGERDAKLFLAFDQEFHDAISKQDVGKLALLIAFPLRVDDEKGSYFIHDAPSLQGRFQDIFTPVIQKTILQSTPETIWCNYAGIDYGNGYVWVNVTDRGYFLQTINMPTALKARESQTIELACSTKGHRVLIDSLKDGTSRYRSWNFGHALKTKPDLEILRGTQEFQGTGPCSHKVWTFRNGQTEFLLEGTEGCSETAPPRDAQAQLSITTPGKSEPLRAWCF